MSTDPASPCAFWVVCRLPEVKDLLINPEELTGSFGEPDNQHNLLSENYY